MAEKVTGKEPNGSPVARLWEFLRSNNKVTVGFVVVAAFFIIAMVAPLLANHEPNQQNLANTYRPPFWGRGGNLNNIFGTDSLGRDIYSRVVYGTRASAYVAVVGASFAGLLGITIGILAGYLKGAVEQITMRIVDMWMSFPPVLFSIALITILGVGINNVVLAIIVIDWTRFARVIRSETLGISERDHVQIAKTLGFKSSTVIREEIIPNVLPIIVVLFTLEMSIAITIKAVDDVSFSIKSGEVFGLVGESGAGKSMTGRAILRLIPENGIMGGRIYFKGRDLVSLAKEEMRHVRGREITIVQQDPLSSLNPAFKVRDQMTDVMKLHLGYDKEKAENYSVELLSRVGISDPISVLGKFPHQLS